MESSAFDVKSGLVVVAVGESEFGRRKLFAQATFAVFWIWDSLALLFQDSSSIASSRRSLPTASADIPPPSPPLHQLPRASISSSNTFIGGPFRVAHDVCVKFNSVDARFEGVLASEEWAVLRQQFGIPLSQMRCRSTNSGDQVPALLHMLRRELLKRDGLGAKYIYRASPEQDEVQGVKKAINSGNVEHSRVSDPHVYASLIKQRFRELPSPLLSKLSFDDIISSSGEVSQVLAKLPQQERAVLDRLLDHMLEVVEKSAVNKMAAQSLAVVMAPNLFNCESVSKTLAGISSTTISVAECLSTLSAWRQTVGCRGSTGDNSNRPFSFAARRSSLVDAQVPDTPDQGTSSIRSRSSNTGNSTPIELRSAERLSEQSHLLIDTDQSLEEMIKLAVDNIWSELEAQGIDSVEMLLADKTGLTQRFESYQNAVLESVAMFSKRSEQREWAANVLVKLENETSGQNLAIPSSLSRVKHWVKAALNADDFLHQLRSEKKMREKRERLRERFPMDCGTESSNVGARTLDPEKTHDLFHQVFLTSLHKTSSGTRGKQEPAEGGDKYTAQDSSTPLLEGALRLLRFNEDTNNSQSELLLRAEETTMSGERESTIGNLLAGLSQSASFSHLHLEDSQEQLASTVQSTLRIHQLLQH